MSNNKIYSFDDNNAFKENGSSRFMVIHKGVVTTIGLTAHHRGVTSGRARHIFSSKMNANEILPNYSYTLNKYNTRQSDILTQLNFVGCLDRAERGFI